MWDPGWGVECPCLGAAGHLPCDPAPRAHRLPWLCVQVTPSFITAPARSHHPLGHCVPTGGSHLPPLPPSQHHSAVPEPGSPGPTPGKCLGLSRLLGQPVPNPILAQSPVGRGPVLSDMSFFSSLVLRSPPVLPALSWGNPTSQASFWPLLSTPQQSSLAQAQPCPLHSWAGWDLWPPPWCPGPCQA